MSHRNGYAVVVTFAVTPEHRAAFRSAVLENAAASLREEPGCSVFDVCEGADGSEVFLYEIYDDEAAFKAHLTTEHFRCFDATVGPWVREKRVQTYHRLTQD